MRACRWLLAACLALLALPTLAEVTFSDAWIRAPLPGQSVTAGYCDIANVGSQPAVVVGFSGSVRVEMHETVHEGTMVRMRPLESLAIAAKSTISLAPGGKHLMLFGLDPTLQRVTLTAVFADQSELPITFAVRPLRADSIGTKR